MYMAFSGFPRDTLYTPTPDPLFGQLLEEIQDLTELKVTLRGMWLLHHKRQGIQGDTAGGVPGGHGSASRSELGRGWVKIRLRRSGAACDRR